VPPTAGPTMAMSSSMFSSAIRSKTASVFGVIASRNSSMSSGRMVFVTS
jgi:hypothetical protein